MSDTVSMFGVFLSFIILYNIIYSNRNAVPDGVHPLALKYPDLVNQLIITQVKYCR